MRCFARWQECDGLFFRDQTILQFGEKWDLLTNFVLLNPGSALPLDKVSQNNYLRFKNLPFFIDEGTYYQFSVDHLMNDLLKLYSTKHSGGVIKIYNLFNLKNQDSGTAIEQYKRNKRSKYIHTDEDEIKYCNAPVVIATGGNVYTDDDLVNELIKYISLLASKMLYAITKIERGLFSLTKAYPNEKGLVESYHPSYTFKYGNTTKFI